MEMEDGSFAIIARSHAVQDLKGMIGKPTKLVSIEEMNAAIEAQGLVSYFSRSGLRVRCELWAVRGGCGGGGGFVGGVGGKPWLKPD